MEQKPTMVTISTGTFVRVIFILLALWFVYLVRDVVALLLVSFLLASAFDGWVDWFERRHIPRVVGILIIYIVILGLFAAAISFLVPPLAREIRGVAIDFPSYWEKLTAGIGQLRTFSSEAGFVTSFQKLVDSLEATLAETGQGVFSTLFSIFGGIVSFIVVLVLTFYMTVSESAMKSSIRSLLPERYQPYLAHVIARIQEKIGAWIQGQLVLSLVIFAFAYLGLTLIGIKYALVLAFFAGLLEFIPYVGPIISAIPAIFLGFTQAPSVALFVLIFYVVMQQLENHFIVPAVMRRALGIHPILSIIAVLIGAKLFGFVGVLLAVPVVTTISVVVQDVVTDRNA